MLCTSSAASNRLHMIVVIIIISWTSQQFAQSRDKRNPDELNYHQDTSSPHLLCSCCWYSDEDDDAHVYRI